MSDQDFEDVDIFPNYVTTPNKLRRLEPLELSSLTTKTHLLPFIFYKREPLKKETPDHKVRYAKVLKTTRIKKHFDLFQKRFDINSEKKTWDKINTRLLGAPKRKRNQDCRLSFKYERHFFVVKTCFTTGLRIVEAGHIHFYEIGQNPLFLYVTNEKTARHYGITTIKHFDLNHAHAFRRMKLQPNSVYVLPAHLHYVLCTFSPGYFSIFVLPENIRFFFDVHHVDIPADKLPELLPPTHKRKRTSPPSHTHLPPPTPLMDEFDQPPEETEDFRSEDIGDLIQFPSTHLDDAARMPPPPSPALSLNFLPTHLDDAARMPPPSPGPSSTVSRAPQPAPSAMPSSSASSTPPSAPSAVPSTSTTPSIASLEQVWRNVTRVIQLVSPDCTQWYQRMMFKKREENPSDEIIEVKVTQEPERKEALDLRTCIRTPEAPRIQEVACQTDTVEEAMELSTEPPPLLEDILELPRDYVPPRHLEEVEEVMELPRDYVPPRHLEDVIELPRDSVPARHLEDVLELPRDYMPPRHFEDVMELPRDYVPPRHLEEVVELPRDYVPPRHLEEVVELPRDYVPPRHLEDVVEPPRDYVPPLPLEPPRKPPSPPPLETPMTTLTLDTTALQTERNTYSEYIDMDVDFDKMTSFLSPSNFNV